MGDEETAVEHQAIENVSVISTGSAEMHREHMYGTRKPALWWVARGKEWIADIPLNVFVIEHNDGLVLFDTGMDPAAASDPDYWTVAGDWADAVVRWFLDRVFRFEIGPSPVSAERVSSSAELDFASGSLKISWTLEAGTRYRLETRPNLQTGVWYPIRTQISNNPFTTVLQSDLRTTTDYFRVRKDRDPVNPEE